MDNLRDLAKVVRNMKIVNHRLYHESDLNENTYECLRYITKHPAITSGELCDYLAVDKALVARMIKKLEQESYICIIVDDNDRRKKGLYPLERAANLKEDRARHEVVFLENCLKNLSENEQELFSDILHKIYNRSKELRKATNKQ